MSFIEIVLIFDSLKQLLSGREGLVILTAWLSFSFFDTIRKSLMAKGFHSVSFTQPSYCLSAPSFNHLPQPLCFNSTKLLLVPGTFLVVLYFYTFYSHCSLCQPCPSLCLVCSYFTLSDTRKLLL